MQASPAPAEALCPLAACAALAAKLLGRAVTACTAAGGPAAGHTVRLELVQSPDQPAVLVLRVCDSGVGLPHDPPTLQRALAPARALLASPCFLGQELALRTTCLDESTVRSYRLTPAPGGTLGVGEGERAAKPPGVNFSGTQAALSLDLTLVSPEEAVACCEQTLGMLRVLGPPLRLGLRLRGVLLEVQGGGGGGAGERRPVTHSATLEPPAAAALPPLERLRAGLCAEYGIPAASPAAADLGAELDAPSASAAPAPPAAASSGVLSFVGVGEAGQGCAPVGPGAAAAPPRGCKWAARVGVVLRMPDHLSAAEPAQRTPNPQGEEAAGGGGAAAAAADEGVSEASVYVFRNFSLQTEPSSGVVAALERCDWGAHGFALAAARPSPGGGGAALALRCAQPASGAALAAIVVHLQSGDTEREARLGRPQGLAAGHEARVVRAAAEAALRSLKAQLPGVMADRRERSAMRAVPCVAKALAAILRGSRSGGVLAQACELMRADAEGLEAALEAALQVVVVGARAGRSQGAELELEAEPDE